LSVTVKRKANANQRDSPILPNYRNPEAKSEQVEIVMKKRMLATHPYAISKNQTVPNRQNQICGKKNKTKEAPQNSQQGESGEKRKRKNTHKGKVKKRIKCNSWRSAIVTTKV